MPTKTYSLDDDAIRLAERKLKELHPHGLPYGVWKKLISHLLREWAAGRIKYDTRN